MLNWNGARESRAALASLALATDSCVTTFLVDNGSDDDEAALLASEYPNIRTIRLLENVGFARGVNVAAREAIASGVDFLLLLNNDAWFDEPIATISALVGAARADDRVAAVGPLVVNADVAATTQSAGYAYSLWFPLTRRSRTGSRVDFLSGSCLLIKAEVFASLGGFDPDFFLYGEDVDLALRLKALGFREYLVADCRVRHVRGASSRLMSSRYIYTVLRGNLIVVRKHARWFQLPTAYGTMMVVSVGLIVVGSMRGNRCALGDVLRAWRDFLHGRWGGFDGNILANVDRPSIHDFVGAPAYP